MFQKASMVLISMLPPKILGWSACYVPGGFSSIGHLLHAIDLLLSFFPLTYKFFCFYAIEISNPMLTLNIILSRQKKDRLRFAFVHF
jgi:hypothetical protein